MLMFDGRDYTLVVLGAAGALFFLAVQLCCCRSRWLWVRLLPVWLLMAGAGYGAAVWFGLLGRYSMGAISGNQIVGLVAWVVVAIAAVGDGIAWLIWWSVQWIRKGKRSR